MKIYLFNYSYIKILKIFLYLISKIIYNKILSLFIKFIEIISFNLNIYYIIKFLELKQQPLNKDLYDIFQLFLLDKDILLPSLDH